MKFFIFLFLVVSIYGDDELISDTEEEKNECIKELKLDASKITNFDNLEDLADLKHDDKCLLRCILQKSEVIDDDGNLVEDTLNVQIPKDLKVDFTKCTPPKNTADPCEQTYAVTQCLVKMLLDVVGED